MESEYIVDEMRSKIEKLESKLREKDEEISNLNAFVSFYKEELENFQRLNQRKLKAYEAILEIVQEERAFLCVDPQMVDTSEGETEEGEIETPRETEYREVTNEAVEDSMHPSMGIGDRDEIEVKPEVIYDPNEYQERPSTNQSAVEADEHVTDSLFECDVCGRKLRGRENISNHVKTHFRSSSLKRKKCGKTGDDLRQHQQDHLTDGNLKANEDLKKHQKNHKGFQLKECPKCDKKFYKNSYLKQHLQVHNSKKKFKCEICQKAFKTRHYVTKHKVVHSNLRKHKCKECGKSFKRSADLKGHLTTHSNERNFVCPVCEADFKYKSHCQRHEKKKHGGKK